MKDLNYSKERSESLEALKGDLEAQINTYIQIITDLKSHEKVFLDKIQKL